jgi:hypothetical protein
MAAKKSASTEIVKWDEELAAAAEAAKNLAAQQAGGGAKVIGIRGGVMTVDGNPVPGNALVGVIAGFTLCNKYFESDFDPDNPASPVCYAYGQSKDEMGPHDEAEKPQNERCTGCPHNEFGSSDKGKGKACKNTYQLMLLPAGDYDAKTDSFEPPASPDELDGELYALSVPPTSLRAFAGYVAQLAGNLRPPWACFTRVSVTPDPKTQLKLGFQLVKNADTDLLAALKARHEEAMKVIEVPFQKNSEREAPPPAKKAAPKRRGRF